MGAAGPVLLSIAVISLVVSGLVAFALSWLMGGADRIARQGGPGPVGGRAASRRVRSPAWSHRR
jgi:hypothetical protein